MKLPSLKKKTPTQEPYLFLEKVFSFNNPDEYYNNFFHNGIHMVIKKLARWNIKNENYTMNVYLVNNNMCVVRDKGIFDLDVVESAEKIIMDVIEYCGNQKMYLIADTSNVRKVTASSRLALKKLNKKLISHQMHQYIVPSKFERYFLQINKTFGAGNKINIASSLCDAFDKVVKKTKNNDVTPSGLNVDPSLIYTEETPKSVLVEAARKYHAKYHQTIKEHNSHIDQLLHVISKIKWDKNFSPVKLKIVDEEDGFSDLFNAFNSLQEDMLSMTHEVKNLTSNLEKVIKEQNNTSSLKETNLRLLIENTENEIAVIDRNFELVTSNSLFNKSYEKAHERSIFSNKDIFAGIKDKTYISFWKNNIKKALKGETFKSLYSSKRGHFEVTFNPIWESENKVIAASLFIKDVTKSKETEKALIEKNKSLIELNRELDYFVYSASHDLRAPLCSLLGLINVVRIQKTQDIDTHLELMENSIQKMDNYVQEIVNYSMNSRLKIKSEPINFELVINECFSKLKYLAGAENIILSIAIEQDAVFYCDHKRVSIIFSSILSNAILYQDINKNSAEINVEVLVAKNKARITFVDNGVGIDPNLVDRVFNMFYRANESSAGPGLGLYIAKQTVERIKGKIWLDSELHKKTSITLELTSLESTLELIDQ